MSLRVHACQRSIDSVAGVIDKARHNKARSFFERAFFRSWDGLEQSVFGQRLAKFRFRIRREGRHR